MLSLHSCKLIRQHAFEEIFVEIWLIAVSDKFDVEFILFAPETLHAYVLWFVESENASHAHYCISYFLKCWEFSAFVLE